MSKHGQLLPSHISGGYRHGLDAFLRVFRKKFPVEWVIQDDTYCSSVAQIRWTLDEGGLRLVVKSDFLPHIYVMTHRPANPWASCGYREAAWFRSRKPKYRAAARHIAKIIADSIEKS